MIVGDDGEDCEDCITDGIGKLVFSILCSVLLLGVGEFTIIFSADNPLLLLLTICCCCEVLLTTCCYCCEVLLTVVPLTLTTSTTLMILSTKHNTFVIDG